MKKIIAISMISLGTLSASAQMVFVNCADPGQSVGCAFTREYSPHVCSYQSVKGGTYSANGASFCNAKFALLQKLCVGYRGFKIDMNRIHCQGSSN